VKNTLATVQSLARQTARGKTGAAARAIGAAEGAESGGQGAAAAANEELERFLEDFQARLLALSRAHDLLTARTWRGASLGEVVAAALAPWRQDEAARTDGGRTGGAAARILVEGPESWLAPRQALGLALGLHELATNAAKHGALSLPGGSVSLRWQNEATMPPGRDPGTAAAEPPVPPGAAQATRRPPAAGLTRLTWTERGGPPVQPPRRRGFGSRLLERGLASEMGRDASVALRYDPEGVEAVIRFRAAAPGHAGAVVNEGVGA
jgi:two-component sensor histidine kinase